MSVRYVKDFEFDPAFGFTGSAKGRADARNHPADADDNEYGDGSYVETPPKLAKEKAKGGRIKRAAGGAVEQAGKDVHNYYAERNEQQRGEIQREPVDGDGGGTLNRTMGRMFRDNEGNEYPDNSGELPEHGMARGGRATGKPSTSHAGDPQGYAMGGAPDMMLTGRPTGVPMMGGAPGVAPAAGPMAQAPAPMGPRPSPLAQGGGEQGPLANATVTMPVHDAARLAHGLVQAGRVGGIRQAIGNSAAARGAAQARAAALAPGAAGSPAAAPPAPVQPSGVPAMAHGGHHITAAQRHRLPASELGLPAREGYPLDTPGRARSALSRASANASPAEQATIRRKVHARYPSIGKK